VGRKNYRIDNKMINKKGFTLIELLVVIAIIIILAVMMIGVFNSNGVLSRANDAQRKKDLKTIKTAFEGYLNDRGYYPKSDLVAKLMDKSNCGKRFAEFPDLTSWPCDPNGQPYLIMVETNPDKFRIIANLENKSDKDIPDDWYSNNDWSLVLSVGVSKTLVINDVNYGVSSSNILWTDLPLVDYIGCDTSACYQSVTKNNATQCIDVTNSGGCKGVSNDGSSCYYRNLSGCVFSCKLRTYDKCPR
jgi:prepilin-type N-terminal cleavage/methylation domain-containing protein